MSFPYKIKPVEKRLNECLLRDITGERTGFIQVGDKKWFFPSKYTEQAAGYYNLPLKKDDVWVMAYPRSGTTWMQELVWLVDNNLDYETAEKIPRPLRCCFLEFSILLNKDFKNEVLAKNHGNEDAVKFLDGWDQPGYVTLSTANSPRHIKSHLPLRLMNFCGYENDFPSFWNYFKRDLVTYSPYWDHVLQAWKQGNHPNMLFIFYEDMTKDLPSCIKKVATFLQKDLTELEIEKLKNYLHIDNFKRIPSTSHNAVFKGIERDGEQKFFRKGGIGGSKDYFTHEMDIEADQWIKEHLGETDLRFPS